MVRQAANSDVFQAIACPTRRMLLDLLAERERPVGDLVDALDISQPSISEQLRVLRETGLVDVQKSGRRRIYRLRPAGFQPLIDWIGEFSRFWDVKFDSLASFLDRRQQKGLS